jgi:uncharacterized protein (TIRG00374 family)
VVVLAGLTSSGAAYLAVRGARPGEVADALTSTNYVWLVPALAAFVLANGLRVLRWRMLFARETRPGWRPATEAFLVGQFFNVVLLARAGELMRVVALNLRTRSSRAEILGTVLLERVFDVLGLLLLFFATLPWLPEVTWLRAAGALTIGLVVALALGAAALALWGDRPLRFVFAPLSRLPFLSRERTDRAASNLVQGLAGVQSARLGITALVSTIAIWIVLGFSCWFVILAFDLGLSPVAGMFVVAAVGLSMALPSAPAALGVFEAAVVTSLAAYGTGRSDALSYALVLHALHIMPFAAAGVLLLLRLRPVSRAFLQPRRASTG